MTSAGNSWRSCSTRRSWHFSLTRSRRRTTQHHRDSRETADVRILSTTRRSLLIDRLFLFFFLLHAVLAPEEDCNGLCIAPSLSHDADSFYWPFEPPFVYHLSFIIGFMGSAATRIVGMVGWSEVGINCCMHLECVARSIFRSFTHRMSLVSIVSGFAERTFSLLWYTRNHGIVFQFSGLSSMNRKFALIRCPENSFSFLRSARLTTREITMFRYELSMNNE